MPKVAKIKVATKTTVAVAGTSRSNGTSGKSIATIFQKRTERRAKATLEAAENTDEKQPDDGALTWQNLEKETMEPQWHQALQAEFDKPYFRQLKDFLTTDARSNTIYPKMQDVYSWSNYTPLDSVRVVVLGQDPYHNVGQAHGLSFSVLPPTKLPGSLRNIYKQLQQDFPEFVPPKDRGDLSPVARQGVLWLNACLTVKAHKANSHSKKGWDQFTAQAIRAVLDHHKDRGVVFMAWGLPAQKAYEKLGIDEKKHLVLKSAHPSPLSAHRGFLGNGHFKAANDWLQERYGEEGTIDWMVLCK